MTTKYVIRQNEFAYNDEWYVTSHIESTRIQQTFDDYDTAKTAYKKLIADHIRSEGFDNYDIGSGEADSKVYEVIDKFTQEKFGETYEDIYEIDFSQCSDDELAQLAQDIDFEPYQLISIDDNEEFYAIWLPYQNEYFKDWNGIFTLENNRLDFGYNDDLTADFLETLNKVAPKGLLEELSNSPTLLERLIDGELVIYKDNQLLVEVGGLNFKKLSDLEAVNALLKQPWFEIRALSIDEFAKL